MGRVIQASHRLSRTVAVVFAAFISVGAAADDDISGTVTSADGKEAGVWVIAETSGLQTSYRKIVVTDDEGRYLLPDLPTAEYSVWVRGYGLLDSAKHAAHPGDEIDITAEVAAIAQQAAAVYPANYWYSLLEVPAADQFPGTGADGNGISEQMRNQALFVDRLKDGCQLCHQMGNQATREIPNPNDYDSTRHAWDQRVQMGKGSMTVPMSRLGREHALDMFADWTNRIKAGEVPAPPPRPDGIEQNLVLTQWGWSNDEGFVHDSVSTDKRNPLLYPGGQVFGVAQGQGMLTITDPVANQSRELPIPMRVKTNRNVSYAGGMPSNPHNPMMDAKNRVWMTSTIRPNENPDWCTDSDHPSVQRFPLERSG
ncbi:MAG: carboxypeptidase-like regulatory domain-containing protein, partial [Gammaproteobacteria bacterium]|nr:carboxypeptidase-like regulatory domain-containing protein [Gammaproteobacteria bacterium]